MPSRKIGNIEFTNINLLLKIGGVLAFLFFGYIFYTVYQSEKSLISITIIPLILGLIFENKRLSADRKAIALKILGGLLLSVFAFMPGKREKGYNFENHIEMWQYWFVFFFVVISMVYHEKKIVPKLTEGITLLQSISIIYWIIDIGFLNFDNAFAYILIGFGLIFLWFRSFTHFRISN